MYLSYNKTLNLQVQNQASIEGAIFTKDIQKNVTFELCLKTLQKQGSYHNRALLSS